jgi:hypothetical protein
MKLIESKTSETIKQTAAVMRPTKF